MEGEGTTLSEEHQEEKEEYVLIDLDGVMGQVHIPSNAPYVLSGLDTLNPILTIDGKIKLVGEYDETVGTCLVFSESDAALVVHEETGPSEANLFSGACIVDSKQAPVKQVKPITSLHKILRFRLMEEAEGAASTDKQTNNANEQVE
ncbi:OLC1v1022888C1 [Oldenlandia corymbosa var. corymbosa]|uniref:OLC1v1022888C1 n=1 Tax=Oldenlandia corymbosa var. corymbosa TaxID=529605 RepID=A0AAV1C1H9_OLDCO|nr:OLC1v1022888C1 [Oldenlandia corymbosa var. corymbosa]